MKKTFKVLILLLIVCVLVTGCFNTKKVEEKEEVVKVISAEKISYSKLNDIVTHYDEHINTDVVDVRSEELFEEGHVSGAINIPYEELDNIIIDLNREITPHIVSEENSSAFTNFGIRPVIEISKDYIEE